MYPLAITRYTLTTSLGVGLRDTLEALKLQRSGLAPCAFETARLDTWTGQVSDLQLLSVPAELEELDCRNNRLAFLALQQDGFESAVAQACERYGTHRIGLFLGTSTSGIHTTELAYRRRDPATGELPADFHYAGTHNNFSLGRFVQSRLRLQGPVNVISTACSSSAKVFGAAARMIAVGLCDAAVVGGADSLCLTTLHGFGSLELLSRDPCKPFDVHRDGISIGEGAGFALLERIDAPRDRRNPVLLGVGESSDGYHMSTPHPEGAGARASMERALQSARLQPADVDYINLHGTATKTNDAAEDQAVYDVFGSDIVCSSTKGGTGHLLGAAGIAEAIVCMLALAEEFVPGSTHTQQVDPNVRVNYLLKNQARAPVHVMSNSFGFGGSNCSLMFGRAA